MNLTRLMRLSSENRTKYIEENVGTQSIQALRHYATEYGILHSDHMSKKELLDAISAGMNVWVESQLLEHE